MAAPFPGKACDGSRVLGGCRGWEFGSSALSSQPLMTLV